jgi:hypothetical protein
MTRKILGGFARLVGSIKTYETDQQEVLHVPVSTPIAVPVPLPVPTPMLVPKPMPESFFFV